MSILYERYKKEIVPKMMKDHGWKNPMMVPTLKKIVISMGIAEATRENKNAVEEHSAELAQIAGQKPIVTKAKKAISNFKLREGQPIGLVVTLRGNRMYDFLYKFCNLVAPRIRDFRGLSKKGTDGQGNYNFGLTDQTIFPEVLIDKVKRTQGMNVTLVTSARGVSITSSKISKEDLEKCKKANKKTTADFECIELLGQLGVKFEEEVKHGV